VRVWRDRWAGAMMRPMKDVGLREVRAARRRCRRLLAMDRLLPMDAAYIVSRLDEIEARVVQMRELDEYGKEVE
jgi:hypothetical protein